MSMMTFVRTSALVAALASVGVGSALAADVADPRFGDQAPGWSGEARVWLQGLVPTFVTTDEGHCGEDGDDYCASVLGVGGYVAAGGPAHDNWSILFDVTSEYHENMSTGDPESDALYVGFGGHILSGNPAHQMGVFAVALTGGNHGVDSPMGAVLGAGFEARHENRFMQTGALFAVGDPDQFDTLGSLFFLRLGGEHQFGHGTLEASTAFGIGDFQNDPDSDDAIGIWNQVAVDYVAPLTGRHDWFIGYQGDFLFVTEDDSAEEQMLLHSVRLGIRHSFGAGDLPFETPNFRAPATFAAEFN